MASIIGTVVDSNLMLVGLKVRGKHSEIYGGHDTTRVEVRCSLSELVNTPLKTAQMDFSSGRPTILGGFKLNAIPMEIYMGGNYTPVDNEIEAIGRITNGKQDVGYRIKLGNGTEYNLATNKIDNIVRIMKPKNFVVRHDEAGRPFIAAKSGKIAELPVIANLADRAAKGSNVRKVVKANPVDLCFEDILTMIASMNGLFAYVPGFVYRASAKQTSVEKEANESIYSGQLAVPAEIPTMSSANINLMFRGLCKVDVPLGEGDKSITLYPNLYREKSVYKNGKLALDTVGVLVEKKHEAAVMESLACAEPFAITDEKTLQYFARIIAKTPGQLSLIGFSLRGIKAYKKVKAVDYNKLAFAVNNYEQVSDALKACSKVEKDFFKKSGSKYGNVHVALKEYNDDELSAIALAGIDLKSFTLVRKAKGESNDDNASGKEAKTAEKNIKFNWTVNLSEAAAAKKQSDIDDLVAEATEYADNNDGEKLTEFIKRLDTAADGLKKEIWEANKTIARNGESKLHLEKDANGIEMVDATSARMRTSKAVVANVTIAGIEQLKLTLNNAANSELVF